MKKLFFLLLLISSQHLLGQTKIHTILEELPAYLLGFDTIGELAKGDLVPVLAIRIQSALEKARKKTNQINQLLAKQENNPIAIPLKQAFREIKTELHILHQRKDLMAYRADDVGRVISMMKAVLEQAFNDIQEYCDTNIKEQSKALALIKEIDAIAQK